MLFTDDLVIVGADHGTAYVYAFEKKTGKVRWKYPAGIGVGTAIIRKENNIYFATLEDKVVCLNIENGKENWVFSTTYSFKSYISNHAPAIISDTVFHGGLDGFVYALNANSGKLTWKRDLKERICTGFAISGNSLYVGTKHHHVYKLNQSSGTIEKDLPVKGKCIRAITRIKNSIVFFVCGMKKGSEILAVDLSLEHVLRRQKSPQGATWFTAKPYMFQNGLLFGTDKGDIFAFNITDGTQIWTHHLEGEKIRVFGSSGNVLYVGTLKGTLYAAIVSDGQGDSFRENRPPGPPAKAFY
jgi:outer membrane protein assembly factor BamB